MKRILVAVVACTLLPSCAYLAAIQHTNDQAIAAWKLAGCAFPLSAIQRNPEIIPALNILCKSGAPASEVVGK